MALIGSLTSGVSALITFEKGMEVIGNNIANVNTTGFKTTRMEYADAFSNVLQTSTPPPISGIGSNTPAKQIGTGVQIDSISSDFAQGTLTTTGAKTDLGISGNGFFRVRDPGNDRDYATRAGNFRLDQSGFLVTSDGFRVQGLFDGSASYDATVVGGTLTYTQTPTVPSSLGDIQIDFQIAIGSGLTNSTGGVYTDAQVAAASPKMQAFTVDNLGNIVISLTNGEIVTRGKILIQDFRDPNALIKEGKNLFSNLSAAGPIGGIALSETNNTPGVGGLGKLEIGTLELSNVDLSSEFANLIVTQRSFQAGSRIITVSDTMLEEIINLKR